MKPKPNQQQQQTDRREDELALYLAENTDLSPNQARELIRRYGDDRAKLMQAARNFKAEG
jgi:hypothetical protein